MNTATAEVMNDLTTEYAIHTSKLNLWYGTFQALYDIDLNIRKGMITSMIGPSGCGKSTFLRSVNRINERLGYVRTEGTIEVMNQNIYDPGVELVQVRKQIGMVFQRPNPLPVSIRDNILFGHKIHNKDQKYSNADYDEIVESSLQQVLLWIGMRLVLAASGSESRSALRKRDAVNICIVFMDALLVTLVAEVPGDWF